MSNTAEAAVIWKLKQDAGVSALVGARVFPRLAPQADGTPNEYGDKPYLIVMRPPGQLTGHTNNSQIPVARTPIFVACVGRTYDESRTLSNPVSAALDPNGWTGSQSWNGTEVASCWQGETYDQSTYPQLGDEIGFPCEFVTFELEHST